MTPRRLLLIEADRLDAVLGAWDALALILADLPAETKSGLLERVTALENTVSRLWSERPEACRCGREVVTRFEVREA